MHSQLSVQHMSGLNEFLRCIQRGRPHLTPPYSACGDSIYNVNLKYLRMYYSTYIPPAARSHYMKVCDAELTACCQTIEWGYGKTANIFRICSSPANFKLRKKNPVRCFIVFFSCIKLQDLYISNVSLFFFSMPSNS